MSYLNTPCEMLQRTFLLHHCLETIHRLPESNANYSTMTRMKQNLAMYSIVCIRTVLIFVNHSGQHVNPYTWKRHWIHVYDEMN